jgi:predicted ATPase
MLQQVRIINFRGFEDHALTFLPTTIIVGRNNAGKSTIVEALRLIALVVGHCHSRQYLVRKWKISRGKRTAQRLTPSLQNLEIETSDRVFHRYRDPPARVLADFSSGARIEITIWPDEIRAEIIAQTQLQLGRVGNLPQVRPLVLEERLLLPDTVKGAMSSTLAPSHFRNQLHVLKELFPNFKQDVEQSWSGLRVDPPEVVQHSLSDHRLTMMVTDGDFTAEVGWMGHGLQMWLQMMWFLVRSAGYETIILDEPDVYMHADLQRKLIRFLKQRHPQVIVATHSAEIMAEVDPDEILIISKAEQTSKFADSLPVAQQLLNSLGSVYNLQLARLATAKRFVFVEGDDVAILKRLQNAISPGSDTPIDTISMPIHGWGGWHYAVGSAQLIQQATGNSTQCYCIFDSDYRASGEIGDRKRDAQQRHIQCHIWEKKELENYLIVPAAITRVIQEKATKRVSESDVISKIEEFAEAMRKDVVHSIGSELQKQNRALEWGTVAKIAEARVDAAWVTQTGRWSIVPGKDLLGRLSAWSKQEFNVSFSSWKIARHLRPEEIDSELIKVLEAIEKNRGLIVEEEPYTLPLWQRS